MMVGDGKDRPGCEADHRVRPSAGKHVEKPSAARERQSLLGQTIKLNVTMKKYHDLSVLLSVSFSLI